jgi:hypothetical protein
LGNLTPPAIRPLQFQGPWFSSCHSYYFASGEIGSPSGEDPPRTVDIGPTTGIVAQQIPGISNRIGKTADPVIHLPNFPFLVGQGAMRPL